MRPVGSKPALGCVVGERSWGIGGPNAVERSPRCGTGVGGCSWRGPASRLTAPLLAAVAALERRSPTDQAWLLAPFAGSATSSFAGVTVIAVAMTNLLPERLPGPDQLLLRRWVPSDAEVVGRAVDESLEHLRPWMPWVSQEPLSLERRRAMIREWEQAWLGGGDVYMGVFLSGRVAGSCGLHYRIGPGGLEIGYWTHPGFIRRGLATRAAGLLTDGAFALPVITRVEIHHDKADEASAGVPRKLGYQFIGEEPDALAAPAEVGVSCRWRLTRDDWERRGRSARELAAAAGWLRFGSICDCRRRRRYCGRSARWPVWPVRGPKQP